MATLKQLKVEAARHGADLEINRYTGEAEVWLPVGEEWQSTSARCAVVCYGYTGAGVMPSIYDDLIELMRYGIYAQ